MLGQAKPALRNSPPRGEFTADSRRAAYGGSFILDSNTQLNSNSWDIRRDNLSFTNHFTWKGLANFSRRW